MSVLLTPLQDPARTCMRLPIRRGRLRHSLHDFQFHRHLLPSPLHRPRLNFVCLHIAVHALQICRCRRKRPMRRRPSKVSSNMPELGEVNRYSCPHFRDGADSTPENPLPPTLLATLITAQHMRPFQALPMLFPPILLFSSYMNVQGLKKDAAGLASAWSMAYFVLARRRKQPLGKKFGTRGIVRGTTMALCVANAVAGGWAYWRGRREDEEENRQ